MDINYNFYRVFYHVAKLGNLTAAAAALMSSQSNITRTIKAMENEMGCTLFVRSNRGVTLTPDGERLFSHIRVAVEHILAAEEELSGEHQTLRGTISVGTSGVALRCFLLPVLQAFRRNHPQVRLRISNHSTPQAVAALKSGAVDLALVTTPVDTHRSVKAQNVKRIRTLAVGGTAFAHLAGQEMTLPQLAACPLVSVGPHTKTYELYSAWFARHGLSFTPDIEAYTSDQVLPIVKKNLGIGFVPEEILAEDHSDQLVTLSLQEPIPSRSVCFLKRHDQTLGLAAKELERMILAAAETEES